MPDGFVVYESTAPGLRLQPGSSQAGSNYAIRAMRRAAPAPELPIRLPHAD